MAESRIELRWRGDQAFVAESPEGASLAIDGNAREGLSPMQALLASTAGCMGIDVVLILKKMRSEPEELSIRIEGDRREEAPRSYTALRLRFRIRGDVSKEKAERAVGLSLEKYCSVFHTLGKDLEVTTEIELV